MFVRRSLRSHLKYRGIVTDIVQVRLKWKVTLRNFDSHQWISYFFFKIVLSNCCWCIGAKLLFLYVDLVFCNFAKPSFFNIYFVYLFIWLPQVLVAVHGIFLMHGNSYSQRVRSFPDQNQTSASAPCIGSVASQSLDHQRMVVPKPSLQFVADYFRFFSVR